MGVLGDRHDRRHNYLLPLCVQVNPTTESHDQVPVDLQVPQFLEKILEVVGLEVHHGNVLGHGLCEMDVQMVGRVEAEWDLSQAHWAA